MVRRPSYHFVQLADDNTLQGLMFQSIKHKSSALELYKKLLIQPPDAFATSLLSNAQIAEIKMMERLTFQHQQVFGPIPAYAVEPMDVVFATFSDGIILALTYNSQAISFEREAMDRLGAEGVGYQLYFYLLLNDMGQQDLLNTLYIYYLHHFSPENG